LPVQKRGKKWKGGGKEKEKGKASVVLGWQWALAEVGGFGLGGGEEGGKSTRGRRKKEKKGEDEKEIRGGGGGGGGGPKKRRKKSVIFHLGKKSLLL